MSDNNDRVDMVHPDLPDTVIHPKAGKTGAYRAGGWVLKSEADKDPAPEPADTEASDPKKRRTTATEKKEA